MSASEADCYICQATVTLSEPKKSSLLLPRSFAMATPAVEEIRASSYVGFDSITHQIEHKLLKRGFQFNVLVVGMYYHLKYTRAICDRGDFTGQTGLGKSTLINTIFASHLIDSKGRLEADEPARKTTDIQAVSHGKVLTQREVVLSLAFSDTTLSHSRKWCSTEVEHC